MADESLSSVAAQLLALQGMAADPALASSAARVLEKQIPAATKQFSSLRFEDEPATYQLALNETAP